jgi:hypothetical protein
MGVSSRNIDSTRRQGPKTEATLSIELRAVRDQFFRKNV